MLQEMKINVDDLSAGARNVQKQHLRWRVRLAHWLTRKLTKGAMHASPLFKATMLGATILWFEEKGQRKFITVRQPSNKTERVGFSSFVDFGQNMTAAERMRTILNQQFGSAFSKSIGLQNIAGDTVKVAPTFIPKDESGKSGAPLQALIWLMQITPAQAELIQASSEDWVVEIVNEAEMLGGKLEQENMLLYRTALQHIHKSTALDARPMHQEALREFLSTLDMKDRVLH